MSGPLAPLEVVQAGLLARWPQRTQQVQTVLSLLGRPSQPGSSFFAFGTSNTGKTSIIRFVLNGCGA